MSHPNRKLLRTIGSLARAHQISAGDFVADVNGIRFEGLSYSTACALYEARDGNDAALVDDFRLEVVRRNWGHEHIRARVSY